MGRCTPDTSRRGRLRRGAVCGDDIFVNPLQFGPTEDWHRTLAPSK